MTTDQTPISRQEHLERFLDWRFGIMLHWGPGAGLGKENRPNEPQMRELAAGFDRQATRFDADQWVEAFRRAGARYVTLTVRHNRGLDFTLYPTGLDDFHSQRDYVGELCAACKRAGMGFFVYLSLGIRALREAPEGDAAALKQAMADRVVKLGALLEEIAGRYPIDGVWFDAWTNINSRARAAGLSFEDVYDLGAVLAAARKIRPDLLVGNKMPYPPHTDFLLSEHLFVTHTGQALGGGQFPAVEVAEPLPGSTWYSHFPTQRAFLSPEQIAIQTRTYTKRLVVCAARGMNYLLNAGPLPDGQIQDVEATMLRGMGDWLRRHEEAIYGTRYAFEGPWGYAVAKASRAYLHAIDTSDIFSTIQNEKIDLRLMPGQQWQTHGLPADGQLAVDLPGPTQGPGRAEGTPSGVLQGGAGDAPRVLRAALLSGTADLPFVQQGRHVVIDCRRVQPDPVSTVIALDFAPAR